MSIWVGMNKKEWQEYYGLTDQEIEDLTYILKLFNGKIINVRDIFYKCVNKK